jgi:hypothetical protein
LSEQDLTDRQKAIRQWVLNNPKKKENDIVKAMRANGQCSRMTTLNEIGELIERQVLEDIRAKPNNFSCIVARDENEYTRIYEGITKIEAVIDAMDKPVEKLFLQRVEWVTNLETEEATHGVHALQILLHMESMYRQSYSLMLQFLWDRTNSEIKSEKDKQALHTLIVNLMMKINRQSWYPRKFKEILKLYTFGPGIIESPLSKKMGVNNELIDKLITTKEDFVRRFLN